MKILVIQNRMGIGDMVIFLPFIEAISQKFGVPVNILVKDNSKAIQFLGENQNIDKIIILDRDNKKRNGRHDGITGFFNLISDLKKYDFTKVYIFNSSVRFNLISKIAGIKEIYQYPLFKKKNQHIIRTAQKFLRKVINLQIESDPKIILNEKIIKETATKYHIDKNKNNILLGIGGSGETKRIPAKIFIKSMKLISEKYDCKFFLATGKNENEQEILNEILNSEFKNKCLALDHLNLKDIMPIIKNCKVSICNDSSFSHLSSALGVKTIVLMSDTPLLYGNYSPRMYPIIPDGEKTVNHNTMGKERINPNNIFLKINEILG
jgi:heptosyltransferase-2